MSIPNEPDFTNDTCSFQYPGDREVDKQRTEFNEKLSKLRDQPIERIQEDVGKYEKLFYGIFYHLTRISFEYKKLSDAIMRDEKDFKKLHPVVLQAFLNTVHCSITQCQTKPKPRQTVGPEDDTNMNAAAGTEVENDASENIQEESKPTCEEKEEEKEEDATEFENLLADDEYIHMMEELARKEKQLDDANKQRKRDMAEENEQQDLKEKMKTEEMERNLKEMEDELREEKERAGKIFEENLKEMRKRREEFEKETERIRLEDVKQMHQMVAACWACIKQKLDWEMKEEEWANWLKVIRQSVSRTINQFTSFTKSICLHEDSDPKVNDINKEQLFRLHNQTLSTYDFLCDAYLKIKDLHEKLPHRKFILILLKHISKVCKDVLLILYMIDDAEGKPVNEELVQHLKQLFSKFDSADILYTFQLRNMEEEFDSGNDEKVEDPEEYKPKSDVVIKEVGDPVDKKSDENGSELQSKRESEPEELKESSEGTLKDHDRGTSDMNDLETGVVDLMKEGSDQLGRAEQTSEIGEKTGKANTTENLIEDSEEPNTTVDEENRERDEGKFDESPANRISEINEEEEKTNTTKNNH